jgi:hypothetical protein
MTLVLAKERSEASIKEALFAKRTMAFFNGELAGKPEHLKGLLKASLKIRVINEKLVEVTNISDITYQATGGKKLYIFPAEKPSPFPSRHSIRSSPWRTAIPVQGKN